MIETHDVRLKRLRLRCWRRGTKEMDLLLGGFSDAENGLAALNPQELDDFERLMDENDQDLFVWISGRAPVPEEHRVLVARLQSFHGIAK